eukprot:12892252-Prorocentrum_lima.AAC.1
MEHGSFLNQHVDACSYITAFFVLPTAHCTSLVALVPASALANDHFGARFSAGTRSLPGIACAES